ncbi:MAG: hypothetical protein EON93_02995 [Burkholderiales bacterium]|nr:MAG: hypothetical protein EON93_02995 [Burkholderiales bacterium]
MQAFAVEISRFVDEHQPGFVECSLLDADGNKHLFIEKVPVVTLEDLQPTSEYPRPGVVGCEPQAEWVDASGRIKVRVSTELPWHVESTEGETVFVVWAEQLVFL